MLTLLGYNVFVLYKRVHIVYQGKIWGDVMRIRCSNCSKIYSEKKKVCPRCGRDNSISPDYVEGGIDFDVSGIKDDIKKKIDTFESETEKHFKDSVNKDKMESIDNSTDEKHDDDNTSEDRSTDELKIKLEVITEKIASYTKNLTKKFLQEGYCEFCGEDMFSSVYYCPRCKRSNNGVKNSEKKHDANRFTEVHKEFLTKNEGVIDRNKYLKMMEFEGFDFDKWNSNYSYKTGIRTNVLVNELIWTLGFILIVALGISDSGSPFTNPGTWIIMFIGNLIVPFVSRHIYERYITFTMKNIDYVKPSRNEGENYSTSVDELENIELVLYEGCHAENLVFTSKREVAKNYVVFSIPTVMYHKNDDLAIFVLMFCIKHNLRLIVTKSATKKPVLDNIASAYVDNVDETEGNTSELVASSNSENFDPKLNNEEDKEKIYSNDTSVEKGYVHVYTGNGKGKTTAAFGVALRSVCAGNKVYIGQFVKDMKYSETKIAEKYPNILIEQLGAGCFIDKNPSDVDVDIAEEALDKCSRILENGEFDLVILDEITIAILYKLLKEEDIIEAIKGRADHVEVIITGRYASEGLIELADLVTEMKEIKHYYSKGVLSREGIDC